MKSNNLSTKCKECYYLRKNTTNMNDDDYECVKDCIELPEICNQFSLRIDEAAISQSKKKRVGSMAKYRKKPIEIEAYQTDKELDIETLEGTMHASVGDWIITGVNGEQYPCKPDIFEKTYEPVD